MKKSIKRMIPSPIIQATRKIFRRKDLPTPPAKNQDKAPPPRPTKARYRGKAKSVLQCCIAYNKHGGYCVPLSSLHRPAAQKILLGRVWERKTIKFITSHCGSGDIVHAGTFFGDFLPALSRACKSDSKVWAFEPSPENYRCALVTIAINDLQNVELHNAGLGAQEGSMDMLVTDPAGRSRGGGCKLVEPGDAIPENHTVIQVDILKVDDVVPTDRNVSLIQLDVERFELQALSGALATIHRCKPLLILENLPREDWLAENIFSLGYRVIGKVSNNSILSTENHQA